MVAKSRAAVLTVLVLGVGAVLAACASESPGRSASDGATYLLPPEDADVTAAVGTYGDPNSPSPDPGQVNGYYVAWNDASGRPIQLNVMLSGGTGATLTPTTVEFDPPTDLSQLFEVIRAVFGRDMFDNTAFEPVADAEPLDPAASYCVRVTEDAAQLMVVGAAGRSLAIVGAGAPSDRSSSETEPCDDLRADSSVLSASRDLRAVDEATWRTFMEEHGTLSAATTTTTTPPPTLDPAVVDYCSAIEQFRGAGLLDAQSGNPQPASLPYLEAIRNTAPDDIRPDVESVIAWLENGSPTPVPPEVKSALGAMTRSWVASCQLGPGATPSPTTGP